MIMSPQIFQRVSTTQKHVKLSYCISLLMLLMAFAVQVPNATAQGSAITPVNIFNAGHNLGLLINASGAGVQTGTYGTWAANTTVEWTASFTPMPTGYAASSLSGPYPNEAIVRYQRQLELITTYSTLCKDPFLKASPWAKHAMKLYRAGYNYGRVNVITAMDCLECLKSPLLALGLDLQDVGLETDNLIIEIVGVILETTSNEIRLTNSRSKDIEVLQGLRGVIINAVNLALTEFSSEPQQCGLSIPSGSGISPTSAADAPFEGSPLGKWKSSYGDIDFKGQPDGTLRSDYGSGSGRLFVHFDGSAFEGYWVQDYPKTYCSSLKDGSSYWGRIRFEYDPAKKVFNGAWGYCEGEMSRKDWQMWR